MRRYDVMKKWIIPIAYSFVSTAVYFISGAVGALVGGNDTGYGGVLIILFGLILYCGIAVPAMCILYSKKCLPGRRLRLLFTLYQSLLIALPYLIVNAVVGLILFAWCESLSLLGLVKLKHKKQG